MQKTANKLLSEIYGNQRMHSKSRGHNPPSYTRYEFTNYALSLDEFWNLYKKWVLSGYQKELTPSCDRMDNTNGYSFDNIHFLTWGEHLKKTAEEHKKGLIVGKLKPVMQFALDGTFIKKYVSSYDAERKTGIFNQNIRKVCRDERRKAGGFYWRYYVS